eukprot:GHRR01021613.1.p1 GENE.GHRR01021613.1~~GHRR01021613.1.p1  ORF type:complete len:123 (-),score=25.38 GHRR01021613.1:645-1013(-)
MGVGTQMLYPVLCDWTGTTDGCKAPRPMLSAWQTRDATAVANDDQQLHSSAQHARHWPCGKSAASKHCSSSSDTPMAKLPTANPQLTPLPAQQDPWNLLATSCLMQLLLPNKFFKPCNSCCC